MSWSQIFGVGVVPSDLSDDQRYAIRNLIKLTEERLWIARAHPMEPEPSLEYTQECSEHAIKIAEQSIQVAKQLIE